MTTTIKLGPQQLQALLCMFGIWRTASERGKKFVIRKLTVENIATGTHAKDAKELTDAIIETFVKADKMLRELEQIK